MQSGGLWVGLKYQMQPSVQCRASRNVKRWDGLPPPHETVDTVHGSVCEGERKDGLCVRLRGFRCVSLAQKSKSTCASKVEVLVPANLLK